MKTSALSTEDVIDKPRICAEWEPHLCALMAWPWRSDIWGRLLPSIRKDIQVLAQAIAEHEPVVMLVPKRYQQHWPKTASWSRRVSLAPFEYDDVWLRDTAPIWLSNQSAIVPRFNGWGARCIPNTQERIPCAADRALAPRLCSALGVSKINAGLSGLVVEGGGLESDGRGTVLLTRSNMLKKCRNDGISAAEVERWFAQRVDATIRWLPGGESEFDFTDSHIDAIARFTPSGSVLYDEIDDADRAADEFSSVRQNALAIGHGTALVRPHGLTANGYECFSYVNFYIANEAIIVPQFRAGDVAERRIYRTIEEAYGREVIPVELPTLLRMSGGGIHCVVRDIPDWVARNPEIFCELLVRGNLH